MLTVPTLSPAIYFCIRRKSLVQTPDDRPKAVELDSAIRASSLSGARTIGMIGAKVSSITSSLECGTRSTTIGGSKAPRRPGS
ncbi:hypothetical protein D9M72_647540 [compost metagenome]